MQQIRLIVLSVLLTMSCHALANVIPQAGLWSIVPESTGKPGRGLAIEVQGDTLMLTVYGYTQDGRATFYLASGPYTNGQFSADLGMYGGGTALGGERVPAHYIGSAGMVSLSFSSEAEGMVTLPGEEAKPITRLVTSDIVKTYPNIESQYNTEFARPSGQFFQIGEGKEGNSIIQSYEFTYSDLVPKDGSFSFKYTILNNNTEIQCELEGSYYQSGSAISSDGNYVCSDGTLGTYRVKNLQRLVKNDRPNLSSQDFYSGWFYFKPQGSEHETFYVLKGAGLPNTEADYHIPPSKNYRSFNPQNGLWWTAAESQGIPGRGFNLDRQGDTLVLTFFGYDIDGHSVFYIASGPFSSYEGFSAELLAVDGGTALGGAYVPAKITGSKGTVTVKFTSDVDGVITLPGEEEQVIKRFTAYDASKRFMQGNGKFLGFSIKNTPHFLQNNKVHYEFSMHDGQFDLQWVDQGEKTRTECIYSGKYVPTGIALYSSGDYKCVPVLVKMNIGRMGMNNLVKERM